LGLEASSATDFVCRQALIFGFRHSSRLAILARPDVETLSAPEFEFALLGVRRPSYRTVF
jgi:hypothetical protein